MEQINFNKKEFLDNSYYDQYLHEFILTQKIYEAYIYIRVSTQEQVENSPYSQLEDILKYCIQKNIYVPKESIFVDGGISGRHADNRLEFQKMINLALDKKNKGKLILVHKFDRFARNREESVIYKAKLRRNDVRVISIKEQLPEDRKMALILENQLETNSELYSINLSDEVYKGLRVQAEFGKHMTKAPYGYQKVVKKVIKIKHKDKIIRDMIINDDEAYIVKMIFEKYINGVSELKIAQELNDLGLTTRDGRKWYDNRIRYILNNVVYLGYSHWTEKGKETTIVKGSFPAIVDQETWDKKEEILGHHRGLNQRTQVKQDHWLRGKLRCSDCGNTLVTNSTSWQCCGYTHGECKISHSIKIKKMEELVLKNFENISTSDIVNINITSIKLQNNDETTIINEKLKKLKIQKERIMTAYENQLYSLEEFKSRKKMIDEEEKTLHNKLDELNQKEDGKQIKDEILKKCGNVTNILKDEEIPILDKQMLLNEFIDKIVFDSKNKTLEFFYKVS